MPRRVREFSLQSTQGGGDADKYLDRVVKYVPADVVAAWTAAVALIKATTGIPSTTVLLISFAVVLGITFWWTLHVTKEAAQPPAYKQAIIAVVAFAVWVLALGDLNDALQMIGGWNQVYAKLILIVFTLVSGRL